MYMSMAVHIHMGYGLFDVVVMLKDLTRRIHKRIGKKYR
jgi:hypothetical protein